MTLEEAILYDYIGEGTLLHYTNPQKLVDSLKKGKIYIGRDGLNTIRPSAANSETIDSFKDELDRPGSYQTKDIKDFGWDKYHSKYNAKDEQMKYDSGNGSVKITIDGSKLKDGEVRGLKINKKNEAGKTTFNKIKHFINSYKDDDAQKFIKEVSPYINKLHTKNGGKKVSLDDLYNSVPKKEREKIAKRYGLVHRGKVMSALEAVYNHRGTSGKRKGTEVINYKNKSKGSTIPINGKFMNFEFTKEPILKDNELLSLAKQIKDNRELFKGNTVLDKILKDAEAIEKGEKPEKAKSSIKIKKPYKKEKSLYHELDSKNGKGFETF